MRVPPGGQASTPAVEGDFSAYSSTMDRLCAAGTQTGPGVSNVNVPINLIPAAECTLNTASCPGIENCTNSSVSGPIAAAPGNFVCEYRIGNAVSTVTYAFQDGCVNYTKQSESGTIFNALKLLCVGSPGGLVGPGDTETILAKGNTGQVLSAQTLNAGEYTIAGTGIKTTTVTINQSNVAVEFFVDTNGDGIKQDAEVDPATAGFTVSLEQTQSVTQYQLNSGWNLIGLDTATPERNKASQLIRDINLQNVEATHVAQYADGQWQIYSSRVNESGEITEFGTDFNLVPGRAVFVNVTEAGTANLTGQKFAASVPLDLAKGWNLVSVQSPNSYTAGSFINKCEAGQVQCDTVSRFENGRYENLVKDAGTLFGNDFNLIAKSGYFVRVKDGSGRITP
jgi:hypothetical protein